MTAQRGGTVIMAGQFQPLQCRHHAGYKFSEGIRRKSWQHLKSGRLACGEDASELAQSCGTNALSPYLLPI